jgi:hypothetical protein
MTGFEYILTKQIAWSKNKGIRLIGSKIVRGRHAYTSSLDDNLFQVLLPDTKAEFDAGDGGELKGVPQKMAAVHSSSALGVNIFQYWQKVGDVPAIAAACGLCARGNMSPRRIRFEQKFEICSQFKRSPNIDVVIETDGRSQIKAYGVECKFSEPYSGRQHLGLNPKYLALTDVWEEIPATRCLAETICPEDERFKYLHAAQLIKHVLGLKNRYSLQGFRLLYLWYDVLGEEGAAHRKEIEKITEYVKQDGILFKSITYQELIARLSEQARDGHRQYIQYISARYL